VNLVATCDMRELRASQILSKWESRGGRTTGCCRGVMFTDVGIRSRGHVIPRRVMKHDVRLRACGRTRRWHVGAAAGTRLATHWSAVRDS
jgi:hypothetical protein